MYIFLVTYLRLETSIGLRWLEFGIRLKEIRHFKFNPVRARAGPGRAWALAFPSMETSFFFLMGEVLLIKIIMIAGQRVDQISKCLDSRYVFKMKGSKSIKSFKPKLNSDSVQVSN